MIVAGTLAVVGVGVGVLAAGVLVGDGVLVGAPGTGVFVGLPDTGVLVAVLVTPGVTEGFTGTDKLRVQLTAIKMIKPAVNRLMDFHCVKCFTGFLREKVVNL